MSCIYTNRSVDIEIEKSEKETLIRAYRILENISSEMYMNDVEEADEGFKVMQAMYGLQEFMRDMGINYEEDME